MTQLGQAVARVRARAEIEPEAVVVVEEALGEAALRELRVEAEFSSKELIAPAEEGASAGEARIRLGRLAGRPVAVLLMTPELRAVRPPLALATAIRGLRLLARPGREAPLLALLGSCTALNPLWEDGDLVLLDDHLNLTGTSPLIGPNFDELGPRFPDMSEPYDRGLQQALARLGLARGLELRRGVHATLAGPQPPTRAECRMLRWMGGDVVGTGVASEVIVARHMGMPVAALLVVTGRALPDAPGPWVTGLDERAWLRAAEAVGGLLGDLLESAPERGAGGSAGR